MPNPTAPGLAAPFARGKATLTAGHLYLVLYDLQAVYDSAEGHRLGSQADSFATYDAFKARWQEMGPPAPAGRAPS